MAIDILDLLSSTFGSQITRQVSALFGDSEGATRTGLRSSAVALLSELVHKSATPGGAQELFRAVSSESVDPALHTRLNSLLENRGRLDTTLANGESGVSSLFGNRTGSVAHSISEVAGIKPASATGLLALVAPVLLSILKKVVGQGNLDARGLGSMLLKQTPSLQTAGLDSRITSAMGFDSLQSMLQPGTEAARAAAAEIPVPGAPRPGQYSGPIPRAPSARRRWIPWAVAAAVAILAIALVTSRGGRHGTQMTATSLPATVYFDVGQSALRPDDRQVIAAVANSVKTTAAPVTVTGYADPTGNQDQNLDLAKNRAAAVRDALVQEGVPASKVLMTAPTSVSGTGSADEARRVEIALADEGAPTRR